MRVDNHGVLRTTFTFEMTIPEYEALKEAAYNSHLTMASYVRFVINEAVDKTIKIVKEN